MMIKSTSQTELGILVRSKESLREMVMILSTSATTGHSHMAMEEVEMIHSTFQLMVLYILCLEAKATML